MRTVYGSLVLMLAMVCMSMTSCPPKCTTGNFSVTADAKQWMPYEGVDSVAFITAAGTTVKFPCLYGDTTRTYQNFNCTEDYTMDSVGFELKISQVDSILLFGRLSSPSHLCLSAVKTATTGYVSGCGIIDGPESSTLKKFSNLSLNGFTYPDARLLNAYPGYTPIFDSVYLAKGYGVVSFRYNNMRYYLKH